MGGVGRQDHRDRDRAGRSGTGRVGTRESVRNAGETSTDYIEHPGTGLIGDQRKQTGE